MWELAMYVRWSIAACLSCCLAISVVADDGVSPRHLLSSRQPAERWEEAMLTGNGNLGAMAFGNPYDETIVVNHCKLYLPLGSREIVEDFAEMMPEFKAAGLAAGIDGPAVVHRMMQQRHSQKIIPTDPFHPAFLLRVQMPHGEGGARDLLRTQNLTNGELAVRWSDQAGDWRRRLFVSRPADLVVLEIAGPSGQLDCEFSINIAHEKVRPEIAVDGGWLSAHTVYTEGKGGYDSLIQVSNQGGELQGDGDKIRVTGADRILVLMQVRTWRTPLSPKQSEAWAYSPKNPDFASGYKTNWLSEMKGDIERAPHGYETLLAPHAAVHGELYGRVSLDLNADSGRRAMASQDLLERAVAEERLPAALMERMYDACRYLMICSTGERPANLQGIWSGTWKPAWSGDYTLDSNLQLEVQSLMSCQMPELMVAYFDLVESWLPDCRLNARKFYGCRGAVSNARASNTCLLVHWDPWPGEQAISCLGWLAHFFYDYYLFTGDEQFLAERAVPLMEEVVLFYDDLLAGTEDENGRYRFYISYSPEHRTFANATFDIGVAKAMLTYLLEASEVIELDAGKVDHWREMLAKMPPYLINSNGELQEWAWPGAPEDFNQRHHSHLLPLYQFNEFDPVTSPKLWEANDKAFLQKTEHWFHNDVNSNSNHITHGMVNQGQCAARLGHGDVVHEMLARFATKRYLYPSFMMSYWPGLKGFGMDPVGTLPDIVNHSLVHAWDGTLDLLPALPDAWPSGSVTGLLARGQLKIHQLKWDLNDGRINVRLRSGKDQDVNLRLPSKWKIDAVEVQDAQKIGKASAIHDSVRLRLIGGTDATIEVHFSDRS